MQSQFNFGVTGCRLKSVDTCLVLEIDDISTLDQSPFVLAGGDVLKFGDKFTGIDKRGSAGLPPIKLTEGWYQEYAGRVFVASDAAAWVSDDDREILLFQAYKIDSGESALDGYKTKYKHTYMAYIAMGDGQMLYWNSCGSSRVVKCESIARYCLEGDEEGLAA